MADNALSDEGITAVASALSGNNGYGASLVLLDLSQNQLGRQGAESLSLLMNHPHGCMLKTLKLSKCRAGDAGGARIFEALQDQVTVTDLDVSFNDLGSRTVAKALNNLLEDNSTLQRLGLGWNEFGSHACKHIRSSLSQNLSLLELDLRWNSVGAVGAMEIGAALRHNKVLQTLDLTHCNVAERGAMVRTN